MSSNCQSTVQSNKCPTYFKYGIPTALALTSALYYGYRWFMAKKPTDKPEFDENLVTVVAGTVPNSPIIDIPLDNKETVPEDNLAN